MGTISGWLFQHGFDLISATGIVASLLFTAASFREGTQSRKLSNLIGFTERHHTIWSEWDGRPDLRRVVEKQVNLEAEPISDSESRFVLRLIFQLYSWYEAAKSREIPEFAGVQADIASFFQLPIPAKVWSEKRHFFDADFVGYVENACQEAKAQ